MTEPGDKIVDFRGREWEFVMWTRKADGWKSGLVLVRDEQGREREFYHQVFPVLDGKETEESE